LKNSSKGNISPVGVQAQVFLRAKKVNPSLPHAFERIRYNGELNENTSRKCLAKKNRLYISSSSYALIENIFVQLRRVPALLIFLLYQ
jgi:hypothetical protein